MAEKRVLFELYLDGEFFMEIDDTIPYDQQPQKFKDAYEVMKEPPMWTAIFDNAHVTVIDNMVYITYY